jgi:hypothetical protein
LSYLDWGISERLSLAQLIIAVVGLLLTILAISSKKLRTASLVLIVILVAVLTASLTESVPNSDKNRFEAGLRHYEAERFHDAISEFQGFLEKATMKEEEFLARAHYYIASSCLRLSPPDCSTAMNHITQIVPDREGLGLKLVDECEIAGCIDCKNLMPVH